MGFITKQKSPKPSAETCNPETFQTSDTVEDYEWDDSKATETAWKWSKRETKLKWLSRETKLKKGKRAYGRRSKLQNMTMKPDCSSKTGSRKRGLHESNQSDTIDHPSLAPPTVVLNLMGTGDPSAIYPFPSGKLSSSTSDINHEVSRLDRCHKRAESLPSRGILREQPCFFKPSTRCASEENGNESENVNPNLIKDGEKNLQNWSPESKQFKSSFRFKKNNSQNRLEGPSNFRVSRSSFSSLSRASESTSTWAKKTLLDDSDVINQTSTLSPSLEFPRSLSADTKFSSLSAVDLMEIGSPGSCVTPVRRHSTSSSRKRCVCESPSIGGDEIKSSGEISIGHLSISSYGSRRARSRIFSPKKLMECEALHCNDLEDKINKRIERCDSDTDENSNSSHQSASDILDESHEEYDIGIHKQNGTYRNFVGQKDGSFKLPPIKPRQRSSIEHGSFAETVFAPVERTAAEKEEEIFKKMSSYQDLKYLVKELRRWIQGKRLVSLFGMNKICTIVPPNKWPSWRKAAFIKWTTSHLGFSLRSGGGMVNYIQTKNEQAINLHQALEAVLGEYKRRENVSVVKNRSEEPELNPRQVEKNEDIKAPFSSIKIISNISNTPLFHAFRSTTKKTLMSIERPIFSPFDNDNVEKELVCKLNLLNVQKEAPLEIESIGKAYQSNEGDRATPLLGRVVAVKDKDETIFTKRPPRLSYDNSFMDNRDFMSHMHGVSPNNNNINSDALPSSTLTIPRRKFGDCIISPAIKTIVSATLSFDGAETPMPKLPNRIWGSRPVAGRDWGQSTRCDETILSFFRNKLDEAVSLLRSPSLVSSVFVNPTISAVAADSDALGFEFEANENKLGHFDSKEGNESLDASDFDALGINQQQLSAEKIQRQRQNSFAKHYRMSICASAMDSRRPPRLSAIHTKYFARSSIIHEPLDSLPYRDEEHSCIQGVLLPISPLKQEKGSQNHEYQEDAPQHTLYNEKVLSEVFLFLNEYDLLCHASLVCSQWADAATDAHSSLMLFSVGCTPDFIYGRKSDTCDLLDDEIEDAIVEEESICSSIALSMQRPWSYILQRFPWGNFLSEGAFKKVYRVWNTSVNAEEAVSVMNVNLISDKNVVGSELSVSVMLSSLVRRNICPNFVLTRGVFTASFEPPISCWGCAEKKKPLGGEYEPNVRYSKPRLPSSKDEGLYQYIRMELCRYGDMEEYIKSQPNSALPPEESRILLFQMAFALHVAGDRFAMKHYDVKLLNFFLQSANEGNVNQVEHPFTVLRYGVGAHVFNLRMITSRALIAKLADYGTTNVNPESDGQPVLLSNFTTLENSPPEFMTLGDAAQQGYGHDCFGLGLCMLHLFTGHAPYEEILESVTCPANLRKKLRKIWEDNKTGGYDVIRSVILVDVYEDENGNTQGERDEVLFDTLYRFLVLFGVPEEKNQAKGGSRVWRAVRSCLGIQNEKSKSLRVTRQNGGTGKDVGLDFAQYESDCKTFSFMHGNNKHIVRGRTVLQKMEGGIDLLFGLVSFDPNHRASALDVINSKFMDSLRECPEKSSLREDDIVFSYMAYSAMKDG